MSKVYVVLNVDEAALLKESNQSSLEEAVSQELGWLHDSGMSVESLSFDVPQMSRDELADDLMIRMAHLAGSLEAKGEISSMEWDDLRACVMDAVNEYDNASEMYLKDPTKPFAIDADQIALRLLKERFPAEDKPSSFYYTFGTSPSFPYKKGWVEVQARNREEADKLFRSKFPDKTPGSLNCSSIYTQEAFERVRQTYAKSPDWCICHEIISCNPEHAKSASLVNQISRANLKKEAEQTAIQQNPQKNIPTR